MKVFNKLALTVGEKQLHERTLQKSPMKNAYSNGCSSREFPNVNNVLQV